MRVFAIGRFVIGDMLDRWNLLPLFLILFIRQININYTVFFRLTQSANIFHIFANIFNIFFIRKNANVI